MNYFFRRWFKELAQAGNAVKCAAKPTLPTTAPRRYGRDNSDRSPAKARVCSGIGTRCVKQVGKGATGVVYKARDKHLKVDIAIKLLRQEYASHPEALERFRQEIVFSRDVVHPNILRGSTTSARPVRDVT